MNLEDQHLFNLLKQAITSTFLANNSAAANIKDWKGDDIAAFQEDLFSKVKASVSEKWFYTYIKNDPEKLPRIDILNLLSNYVGLENWNAFKRANKNTIPIANKKGLLKKSYLIIFILSSIVAILYVINTKNEFQFCFVDLDKNETIKTVLDVKILKDFESPIYLKTDSLGCFSYTTKDDVIKFVVQSPYYKTDTITRSINANTNTTINLQTDDYTLMLHYYSNGNVKDWKKRKQHLKNLIAEEAQIYQIHKHNIGVELYSKDDFINKLTIPTSSLKNIKIIDKSYEDGKIIKLKFMVK